MVSKAEEDSPVVGTGLRSRKAPVDGDGKKGASAVSMCRFCLLLFRGLELTTSEGMKVLGMNVEEEALLVSGNEILFKDLAMARIAENDGTWFELVRNDNTVAASFGCDTPKSAKLIVELLGSCIRQKQKDLNCILSV